MTRERMKWFAIYIAWYIAAIAIMTALARPVRADEWSRADTARELVFAAEVVVDNMQTHHMLNHAYDERSGRMYYEQNPLLGPYPKHWALNLYSLWAIGIHVGVAAALPSGWMRQSWQYAWIGVEGATLYRNNRLMTGLQFSW